MIWRLLAVFILLSGCESVPKGAVAEKIGTDARTPRRYHHLASHPYGDGLLQTGFVVAIEKAPKPSVGQGAWRERITPPAVPAFAPEVVAKFKEVKVLGYANKADDADEIGFTLGNWIVNRLGVEEQRRRGQRRRPTVSTVFVWSECPRSGKRRP